MINKYLRAIGFSDLTNDERTQHLLDDIKQNPSDKTILGLFDSTVYVEYIKYYGDNIGICIRGSMNENEEIKILEYFPFVKGDRQVQVNDVKIFPSGKTAIYFGTCVDDASGNNIIFFLSNLIDYFVCGEEWEKQIEDEGCDVNFAGLSNFGTIVLPVLCDEYIDYEDAPDYEDGEVISPGVIHKNREKVVQNLDDASETIMERLQTEDFLSVVESYIVPRPDEDASYYLLGSIDSCQRIENMLTDESIWKLVVDVTGSFLTIFINESDLLGLPSKGMRFMGTAWLQGEIL